MNIWLHSLACASLVVCATPIMASPRPAQNVFDDAALQSQFETRMGELMAKEKPTPPNVLKEQLSRKSCKLELPVSGSTVMTPAEIYQQRLHSVVILAKLYHCPAKDCRKVHTSVAGGVILREDGIVLTNHHVVADKQAKELGMGVMTADGKAYLVDEVLAANKDADVAILRLRNAKGLAAAPLMGEEPVGNAVTLISHPAGNFFFLSHGRIARYRKGANGVCTMQVTADYAKGSSGGPIFNDCGEVVGVISSTISIPYWQLPVTIDPQNRSLAAAENKPPSKLNGMPVAMDMSHQMTFKNAVASREVLELIE